MNGISVIIPGADFSNSPLGSVNFVFTPEEKARMVVSAYASAIGTAVYNDALYEMVRALSAEELYDKIVVFYPMLGTTIADMSVNLVDPGHKSLQLRENASVSGVKLSFSNTIEVSTEDTTNKIWQPLLDYNGYGYFFKMKRNSSGLNKSEFLDLPNFYTWSDSGRKFVFENATRVTITADPNTEKAYAVVRQRYSQQFHLKYSLNGETLQDSVIADTNKTDAWWYGSLGVKRGYTPTTTAGTAISASSDLWDGTVSYLLFTNAVSDEEIGKLSQILATFCSAVGK